MPGKAKGKCKFDKVLASLRETELKAEALHDECALRSEGCKLAEIDPSNKSIIPWIHGQRLSLKHIDAIHTWAHDMLDPHD